MCRGQDWKGAAFGMQMNNQLKKKTKHFLFAPVLGAEPLLYIPANAAHIPVVAGLPRHSDKSRITGETPNTAPIPGGARTLDPGRLISCLARDKQSFWFASVLGAELLLWIPTH